MALVWPGNKNYVSMPFMRILVLAISLVFSCGCSSMLYYPTHHTYVSPDLLSSEPRDIYVPMADGTRLHGWQFTPENPSRGTVIFFHGNAENLTSHFIALNWLLKHDYAYIIFDYPGYGQSTGEPTPETTVQSGIEVIKWVHMELQPTDLFIYGHSLGGTVALRSVIEVHKHIPINGIILDGAFSSYQKVVKKALANSWFTWPLQPLSYVMFSDEWAPQNFSALEGLPKLIVHSKKDPVVDFSLGKELFDRLSAPKIFYPLENGSHGDSFSVNNGENQIMLLNFLNENRKQNFY